MAQETTRRLAAGLGVPQLRTRTGSQVDGIRRYVVTLLAGQHGAHRCAAIGVGDDQGSLLGIAQMSVSPVEEGDECRLELDAGPREPVFLARAAARHTVGLEPKHPLGDQVLQTGREDVAGDAQSLLEDLEAGGALECLPEDQPCPPIRQDADGSGHRAVGGVVVLPGGRRSVGLGHSERVAGLCSRTQMGRLRPTHQLRRSGRAPH